MNIQQMMKQAQRMQEQMQKQMAETTVEGSAGGGMVTISMNGMKQLRSVKIEPDAVSSGDVEMLQDLILAAFNEAARKVDEQLSSQLGGLTGGMKIPGLF
jgi:DNA-binding YbaB/EbfC family protein